MPKKNKRTFQVGQVVWEKNDCSFVRIHKIDRTGGLLQVERFGNFWNVLPHNLRPLTAREIGPRRKSNA